MDSMFVLLEFLVMLFPKLRLLRGRISCIIVYSVVSISCISISYEETQVAFLVLISFHKSREIKNVQSKKLRGSETTAHAISVAKEI